MVLWNNRLNKKFDKKSNLIKIRQPEVAVGYSCLFFLSIYNLFIIKNYLKKIKYIIKFINKYKLRLI
jgi:hypothetical protein